METENSIQKWINGQISLGAAANWETGEIRIISEIAYTLAQQGRFREAILLFEGLLAIAPKTAYFQSALGALNLRLKRFSKAIEHLDAALTIDSKDIVSLVNRGEAHLLNGNLIQAINDLEQALQLSQLIPPKQTDINDEIMLSIKRATALLKVHQIQT